MNDNIEILEDNNIINKKFSSFTDYFNQLEKKDKIFLAERIISGYLPNLHIYTNLIEPVDFTEYISDMLYKNYIYNIINKNKICRRYRENIGKSKLCMCTYAENLEQFAINPKPIGYINDISDLSDSDESLDSNAEILYVELDENDNLEFNVININININDKYDDFINIICDDAN